MVFIRLSGDLTGVEAPDVKKVEDGVVLQYFPIMPLTCDPDSNDIVEVILTEETLAQIDRVRGK